MRITHVSSLLFLALTAAAQANPVIWTQGDMGAATGGNNSQTATASGGELLNVTTANGSLQTIGGGEFGGVWISQATTSDGTYVVDFNGAVVSRISMTVNAISGNGTLPAEAFDQWSVAGGVTSYDYTINSSLSAFGATLGTLQIIADQGNDLGVFTITFENAAGMTGFSFRHTQNPDQNGSVINTISADIIPAPATGALAALSIFAAARRRR